MAQKKEASRSLEKHIIARLKYWLMEFHTECWGGIRNNGDISI
jgi:hypothetical protein